MAARKRLTAAVMRDLQLVPPDKPVRPVVRWGSCRFMLQSYRAKDGWRWRLWTRNGRVVADSGEAYDRRDDSERTMRTLCPFGGVMIVVVTDAAGQPWHR